MKLNQFYRHVENTHILVKPLESHVMVDPLKRTNQETEYYYCEIWNTRFNEKYNDTYTKSYLEKRFEEPPKAIQLDLEQKYK